MIEEWTDEQEYTLHEDIRIADSVINVYAMFPEAAKRVQILEELKRSWYSVVRHLARDSEPYCLGVNELYICTNNPRAAGRLMNMKGTILRAMSKRWGYEPLGDFSLKITDEHAKAKKLAVHTA